MFTFPLVDNTAMALGIIKMEEECNIMELVSQLKQEKLLITSEKNEIKCLHEKVSTITVYNVLLR